MRTLRTLAALALLTLGLTGAVAQQPTVDDAIRRFAEAEALYAERSYARAHQLYAEVDTSKLTATEKRWVEFRTVDTAWRAAGDGERRDAPTVQLWRAQLESIVDAAKDEESQDRIWAEAEESLGDLHAKIRSGQAQMHHLAAATWWGRSSDLALARRRYLDLVWKMGGYQVQPMNVLENALKIAVDPSDRAHAAYLLALQSQYGSDPAARDRAEQLFETAIQAGRTTEWYDHALYQYAQWLARAGRATEQENGEWRIGPDLVKAEAIYRRLISEFKEGETRYWRDASREIGEILSPKLDVSVPGVFVPGSELEFGLSSRNVDAIAFEILSIDLPTAVRPSQRGILGAWTRMLRYGGAPRVASWTKTIEGSEDHVPRSESIRIEKKLEPGAYVLIARFGRIESRELLLVSDATIVLRTSKSEALAFVADAYDGQPIAGAKVRLLTEERGVAQTVSTNEATTGADGIARFPFAPEKNTGQLLAVASRGKRQAFAQSYRSWSSGTTERWIVYAHSDRNAYRPGETAKWKITARLSDGTSYRDTAGASLRYEILDPRGATVAAGDATLNSFGSFWSELPLTSSMPLGIFRLTLKDQDDRQLSYGEPLFRLEEYKLPEFFVTVSTPTENGRPKVFRLGDRVTASIRAEYYFGGGVPNASVEVVINQRPFSHYWRPFREYDWYRSDVGPRPYYGNGSVVERQVVRTDAAGNAEISFDTPPGSQGDVEYTVEARVTDASRREVRGSGKVRVARHSYFVTAVPEHHLHAPGTKAQIDFHAEDPNGQPVATTGTVRVVRERPIEIWRDPQGRLVEGAELDRLRAQAGRFPPAPRDGRRWTLERRSSEEINVARKFVTTDSEGNGKLVFTPDRDGYFRVIWSSDDRRDANAQKRPSDVVRAETAIWVASAATKRLGHRVGGIQVIADRDTYREGDVAHVMLIAPASGTYVLLGIEADDVFDSRLLALEGDAKLVEIPIEAKHVPNFFVSAYLVSDLELLTDSEQIVVPPVRKFVDVKVEGDSRDYRPGARGKVTVTTVDADGRPVDSEVALSVSDLSVDAIQSDLARDPRKVFYGTTRRDGVTTTSSFASRQYVRLTREEVDAKPDQQNVVMQTTPSSAKSRGVAGGVLGGVVGGVISDRDAAFAPLVVSEALAVPAPASAPVRAEAAAEEIVLRSNFSSTALWIPDVRTGPGGSATVDVTYPDSLTTWKMAATAIASGTRVGRGSGSVKTSKPLMVRLQSPRFLVAGDEATISAIVNNATDTAVDATVDLELSGVEVVSRGSGTLHVQPNGDARADWVVRATSAGSARLRVTGRAGRDSDGMERELPVFEHGIDKLVAVSGRTRGGDTTAAFDVPKDRRRDTTSLVVQVTPSIAVTMLDALPYLVEFPYGCTEQTMSRFLPAVITLKTLADLGMSREDAAWRIFGGIEQSTALATHRSTTGGIERIDAVTRAGLERLYDFQHGDGGWGWWKEGASDPYMSGYVVWGLALARDAGVPLRDRVLERGIDYLQKTLVQRETGFDDQAWMLHALATARKGQAPHELEAKAIENVWANREQLRAYSRALFALALQSFGSRDRAQVLVRNLENGVQVDRSPDRSIVSRGGSDATKETLPTARWGERGFWWRWSDGPVESTAMALRALVAVDPKNPLVEPAMNWLVKNRRGAQWSSTKETAIAVLALNEYLRGSGELASEGAYEISVNGTSIAKQSVTPKTVLRAPSRYAIDPKLVRDGRNEIRIVRTGGASDLYFGAEARFFSLEEPVTAAANQLFVKREYFRLAGRPTLLAGWVYDRVPLEDGAAIASGERIEVAVTIEAKNDFEYLIFEDLKPAGFEAVALQSGETLHATRLPAGSLMSTRPIAPAYGGDTVVLHQELRDRKVATFADRFAQGVWQFRYTLRAETPGTFHALPLLGAAMYVPEIRANGEEVRVKVTENN